MKIPYKILILCFILHTPAPLSHLIRYYCIAFEFSKKFLIIDKVISTFISGQVYLSRCFNNIFGYITKTHDWATQNWVPVFFFIFTQICRLIFSVLESRIEESHCLLMGNMWWAPYSTDHRALILKCEVSKIWAKINFTKKFTTQQWQIWVIFIFFFLNISLFFAFFTNFRIFFKRIETYFGFIFFAIFLCFFHIS